MTLTGVQFRRFDQYSLNVQKAEIIPVRQEINNSAKCG
jgi:hypothetical protein